MCERKREGMREKTSCFHFLCIVSIWPRFPQNVNVTDQNGQTALSIACKEGHLEVVHLLLAVGRLPALSIEQVPSSFY